MSWLKKLQQKSHKEKIRIIWLVTICFTILLVLAWIFTSKIPKIKERDTTLFQIIGRGARDVGNNFKKP